jgi:hypothetical protein
MFNKILRFGESFGNVDSNSEDSLVKAMNENIRTNPIERNKENYIGNIMQNIDISAIDLTEQFIGGNMEISDIGQSDYCNIINIQNMIPNEIALKNITMNGHINQIILKRNMQIKDTKYNAQFKLVRNSKYSNHNKVKEVIQNYFTNNRAFFFTAGTILNDTI